MFCQEGATPLHIAAQVGRVEMLRLLMEKGASVEAEDEVRASTEWAVDFQLLSRSLYSCCTILEPCQLEFGEIASCL